MTIIFTDAQPRGLGYIEIDQRSVEAPLPLGAVRYFEADTYTCSHCQVVVILNPQRKRERYKCKGCNHHICDNCAAKRVAGEPCETFWQKAEELMNQAQRHPDHSLILPSKE